MLVDLKMNWHILTLIICTVQMQWTNTQCSNLFNHFKDFDIELFKHKSDPGSYTCLCTPPAAVLQTMEYAGTGMALKTPRDERNCHNSTPVTVQLGLFPHTLNTVSDKGDGMGGAKINENNKTKLSLNNHYSEPKSWLSYLQACLAKHTGGGIHPLTYSSVPEYKTTTLRVCTNVYGTVPCLTSVSWFTVQLLASDKTHSTVHRSKISWLKLSALCFSLSSFLSFSFIHTAI